MKTLEEIKQYLEKHTRSTWINLPDGLIDCAFTPDYKEQVEKLVGETCLIISSKTTGGIPMVFVTLKEGLIE